MSSRPTPRDLQRMQQFPTIPTGTVIQTYDAYLDAQQAVDKLSKAEFDVSKVSIVGSDLKAVERVIGRSTYAKSALSGAASGAWFGLFVGLLFMMMGEQNASGLLLFVILIGAGFGMILGVISYAASSRRKDFLSINQVIATSYALLVEPASSGEARRILGIQPDLG